MFAKVLLILGLLAMSALFVLSLVLYKKDKRMDLAVMGFALATAVAMCGVTATMRGRAEVRRATAIAAEAARAAQTAEVVAASTNETWFSQPDGSYIHADGSSAGSPASASAGPELPQSAPAPGLPDGQPQEDDAAPTPA